MRITLFSMQDYERPFHESANARASHDLRFLAIPLNKDTAGLAEHSDGVCLFVNDRADSSVLELLHDAGVRLVALRCAGFNQTDIIAAHRLGLTVARVPAYSPEAVAEHAVGLILTLNRKFHRAYARVREGNFSLRGLMGFNLHGRTVGVVGTGRIGTALARILVGFGCRVLANDPTPTDDGRKAGALYIGLEELLRESDIISLNCPLTPATSHLINDETIAAMKSGVMLINTSRGAVIDTRALIGGLKSGHIGSVGLDVYEEEADLFFRDLSETVIQDDIFARLLTFPNVMITAHQGFFTREALTSIAETTIGNVTAFERGSVDPANLVTPEHLAR